MTAASPSAAELVAFWREAEHRRWFASDAGFDALIAGRFAGRCREAAAGALSGWADSAEGALALVLLTDQLPRNLHRGCALAYATDPLARAAADEALRRGFDRAIPPDLRPFLYMPLEHAEDPVAQARAVALFTRYAETVGDPHGFLRYAFVHQDVIRRFGRFPHRNGVLGRTNTPEERAFLEGGGFSG